MDHRGVPEVLCTSFKFIEDSFLEEPGLFRMFAKYNEIADKKQEFEMKPCIGFSSATSPHLVTGLIKQYFRDLPDCLLSCELYDEWLSLAMDDSKLNKLYEAWLERADHTMLPQDENISSFDQIPSLVAKLPQQNQQVLGALVAFLNQIEARKQYNQCSVGNC